MIFTLPARCPLSIVPYETIKKKIRWVPVASWKVVNKQPSYNFSTLCCIMYCVNIAQEYTYIKAKFFTQQLLVHCHNFFFFFITTLRAWFNNIKNYLGGFYSISLMYFAPCSRYITTIIFILHYNNYAVYSTMHASIQFSN